MEIDDLGWLFRARRGLPSEPEAVTAIATFACVPGVLAGIVLGNALMPTIDDILLVVGAGFGGAAVVFASIFATYRLLGFRAVTVVADGLVGFCVGLMLMECLPLMGVYSVWWPVLAGPIVAIVVGRGWRANRKSGGPDAEPDTAANGSER